MTRTTMSAEALMNRLQQELGDRITEAVIRTRTEGVKKTQTASVWVRIRREALKDAIRAVIAIDFPHLCVISGVDCGDHLDLNYHLSVFFGIPNGEIKLTFLVPLPKDDLTVPTISDLIPGAAYGEREKQEMLGITVTDIPDGRRLFLPDDFPEGVYPWRKDETGIRDDMVKELWKVGRPEDRPLPDVPPKEKKKPAVKKEDPGTEKNAEPTKESVQPESEDPTPGPDDQVSSEKGGAL